MAAKDLTRFSMTIETELFRAMNDWLKDKPDTNRSEFIRDLIRSRVSEEPVDPGDTVGGIVTYGYDHHQRELDNRITEYSHHHHEAIISSMHIHIDHHDCLEVVALKGTGEEVQAISDQLLTMKGISFGRLSVIQNRFLQNSNPKNE